MCSFPQSHAPAPPPSPLSPAISPILFKTASVRPHLPEMPFKTLIRLCFGGLSFVQTRLSEHSVRTSLIPGRPFIVRSCTLSLTSSLICRFGL